MRGRRVAIRCAWALPACAASMLAVGPAAFGQAPTPGCAGLAFSDAREDAVDDRYGFGFGPAAPPSLDVLAGWLRRDGDIVTANMRVVDLRSDVPSGAQALVWRFLWHAGATRFYVAARTDGASVSFVYGIHDTDAASYTDNLDVAIRGVLHGGPDGVVSIELPARHAQPGIELERPFAQTEIVSGGATGPAGTLADRAPDAGEGVGFRVAGCDAPAPAPPPVEPPMPRGDEIANGRLPLFAVARIGSARRANARRSLGFKIRAGRTITGLTAHLLEPGGRVVAAGGMRVARGVRALKLSLRRRATLRTGRYVLRAAGTVDGRRESVRANVRVTL